MANITSSQNFVLAPGETLACTTDAASSFRYGRLSDTPAPGGDVPSALVAVPASSTIIIGAVATISRWLIDSVVGPGVNITKNAAQPAIPTLGATSDLLHLHGAGVPAASLGANHAATGSQYTDLTAGKLYINSGSKASPSWRIVTSA